MSNPSGGAQWEKKIPRRECRFWHTWGTWTEHVKNSGSITMVQRCLDCGQVHVNTITLKHYHDWEPWGDATKGTMSHPWGSESTVFCQQRWCKGCGVMDFRMIDPSDL